jgi:hypothetical protein
LNKISAQKQKRFETTASRKPLFHNQIHKGSQLSKHETNNKHPQRWPAQKLAIIFFLTIFSNIR